MISEAHQLWWDLYASVFSNQRHKQLWRAMVQLSDYEKRFIDEDAVEIIERFLKERDRKPKEKEMSGIEWAEGYEQWRNKL